MARKLCAEGRKTRQGGGRDPSPQRDDLRGSLDLVALKTLSLTPSGRRALGDEIDSWQRFAEGLGAVLRST